ncbi:MOSC domain-containing protein [soil metagenome]
MDAVRATGAFGPSEVGTATALFRGRGGVPKEPVGSVEVDHAGVVGDRQANRSHHGSPWQALCLWSTEAVDALRTDGHPIAPGLAGENVSLTGLPWDRVRPGVRLRVGDVLAEVSAYAVPCAKNAGWFVDGRFDVMHHRHGPVSRVYATVVEPGSIIVGSPALLEPSF